MMTEEEVRFACLQLVANETTAPSKAVEAARQYSEFVLGNDKSLPDKQAGTH